jgi:hypothetical protein
MAPEEVLDSGHASVNASIICRLLLEDLIKHLDVDDVMDDITTHSSAALRS